ncbi:creatininase family protein [Streptomyces sp. SAS_270]|uniref:creatininase family protein n=1 Tax=Streptomyces sp. SAS_270 TaxID=3412748 RepID=UPI00403CED79
MSEVQWNRLTVAELCALAARDAVVLLPIWATEQHGPHPPTGVDDFLPLRDPGGILTHPDRQRARREHDRVASAQKGERMLSGCAVVPALADIILRDPWAK